MQIGRISSTLSLLCSYPQSHNKSTIEKSDSHLINRPTIDYKEMYEESNKKMKLDKSDYSKVKQIAKKSLKIGL